MAQRPQHPDQGELKRRDYKLTLDVTISLEETNLFTPEELITARVNEMLGQMEHHDSGRILLVHSLEVKEIK